LYYEQHNQSRETIFPKLWIKCHTEPYQAKIHVCLISLLFIDTNSSNGFILLLSKLVLVVPSLSLSVLLQPLVIIACYVFETWILPMKTLEVITGWHLPEFKHLCRLDRVLSCILDIVCFGRGNFLAVTYVTNVSLMIPFFIPDAIWKLNL